MVEEARFHTVPDLVRPPPFVVNYAPTGQVWAVAIVNSSTKQMQALGRKRVTPIVQEWKVEL